MYINYSKYSDSIALVILISKIEYSKCPEHFSPYFFYLNFLCIFFLQNIWWNGKPCSYMYLEHSNLGVPCLHIPFCQKSWCMKL